MPQVAIIKHICCMEIIHWQLDCKAQHAQIIWVLKINSASQKTALNTTQHNAVNKLQSYQNSREIQGDTKTPFEKDRIQEGQL